MSQNNYSGKSNLDNKIHKSGNICLVHYHELGLKGRNRTSFERQLKENIERCLRKLYAPKDNLENSAVSNKTAPVVSRISGRLLVNASSFEELESLARVICKLPGVVRVSTGLKLPQDLDAVKTSALKLFELCEPYESFKVDARRANTSFAIDSMQINQDVGAWLCAKLPHKKVKMREPDVRLHIEMIEGSAFVYCHTYKGVGGLPAGSAGHVVSLMSAGLDSPVATFRMIKRGAFVTALHFSGRPQTNDTSEYLVKELLGELNTSGGVKRLCVVPFGNYQLQIANEVPTSLRVIFYRLLMFATANLVADRYKAKAIVTGESLGQVASQTLDNIFVVNEVAKYPVFRPLIGSDKQEIVNEAQSINTFELSSQAHDDCCTLFMPRNPQTHAKSNEVSAIWQQLPYQKWLEEIMATLEVFEKF